MDPSMHWTDATGVQYRSLHRDYATEERAAAVRKACAALEAELQTHTKDKDTRERAQRHLGEFAAARQLIATNDGCPVQNRHHEHMRQLQTRRRAREGVLSSVSVFAEISCIGSAVIDETTIGDYARRLVTNSTGTE